MIALSIRAFSQSDTKLRLGVGTAYASEVESTGLTVKGIYGISNKWEGSLAYTYFFENLGLSWNVIDLDGNFVFYDNKKKFSAYALAGLAVTFWKREPILFGDTRKGSYTGMNIGIGANIALSEHLNLAPEIRGTLFELSYTRVGLTLQYVF